VRFARGGAFNDELRRRVDAYFDQGRRRRDMPRMYLKSAIILAWFAASWALLVFAHLHGWQAALLAVSLGLSIAAVGMSIQHDANHNAYSDRPWVNRTLGLTLDLMGVCSHIWKQKHNVIHHAFTNVQGVDYDLDFGSIARISSEQVRRPAHRYQHLYMWFLYGLLLPKWVFWDDFVILFTGRISNHAMPSLSLREKVKFLAAKVVFVGWSLVLPSFFHPIWQVLLFHVIAVLTVGVTLSIAFQLAHCVEEARFPSITGGPIHNDDWSAHQVETTVDFSRGNRPLAWFLGGLSFQVEHHLFPKICHLHYEALSHIVEEVAAEHGIRYRTNATCSAAVASHYRHLQKLGARYA
jgi:linoleoyl-CoA desaturase